MLHLQQSMPFTVQEKQAPFQRKFCWSNLLLLIIIKYALKQLEADLCWLLLLL